MKEKIILTKLQNELMSEFYGYRKEKVLFNKKQRKCLWNIEKNERLTEECLSNINERCPALVHRILIHRKEKKNIQSAVFSECVYAQTFANIFGLNVFTNCYEVKEFIPMNVQKLLESYSLVARYVYSNNEKSRMLIQAGSCGGIDSALITVFDCKIFTIEFKEPYAKSSEPDLPKYKEDGLLQITNKFLTDYPQFEKMLLEQKKLNFFDNIGNNIHNFSEESIKQAITSNYVKKYADVVCTEDKFGYLTMLPINQIPLWAAIEGEIRPAGRNHYDVFTPNALLDFLKSKNAKIENDLIELDKNKFYSSKERGSNKQSRYKINSLFFVYIKDCINKDKTIVFNISKVRQLNPTIAAKMNFKGLNYNEVKTHYGF